MQALRRILVVIHSNAEQDPALERARLIAHRCGARLHLLQFAEPPAEPALRGITEALCQDGLEVTSEFVVGEPLTQRILDVLQAQGSQLIVKHHNPDSLLRRLLLTPDDWKLLRHAPVPVLLTKHARPWSGGKVLAAVDAGNADGEHRQLHGSILAHAAEIARLAEGELHLISSYPSPMLCAADPGFQLEASIAQRYREGCARLQREQGLADAQMHILQGPADVNIPLLAEQLDAVVTVLGTVARTGLAATLIGNTAESVLERLDGDVLVIKPADAMQQLERLLAEH